MQECFGVVVDEVSSGIEAKPLNSYLAESLNVELINIILQGITMFAEPEYLSYDRGGLKEYRHLSSKPGEISIRQLELDRITIENPTKWDGSKTDKPKEFKLSVRMEQPSSGYINDRPGELSNNSNIHQELNIYENVKVFDFYYKGFHKLRHQDGITKQMIQYSFKPDLNFKNIKKAGESKGKSGSFMFFTHDKRFIIKTMFQEEVDIFIQHCHRYFEHIENGKSLLARIYGIFQVKMIGIEPIYFQMMANTIQSKQNLGLKTYDLKGSLVGRYTVPDENQTKKDKNLLFAKINRVLRKKKGML